MTQTSYAKAAAYWQSVDPSVEGMLGGFGVLSDIDCDASVRFLSEFAESPDAGSLQLANAHACDCGAGIGRVSKHFLLKLVRKTDLVEQCSAFLAKAKSDYLKNEVAEGRVESFFPVGLQDFDPVPGRYDIIWSQWVLGHLTDDDLVAFFKRCKAALRPDGIIAVKENICPREAVELDEEDSSVTRPAAVLEACFRKAGLTILKKGIQPSFPAGLFPVFMYILR
ncbi:N-terminal Xaa-Pro-Lys N-methyltransferase 1 [Entophlyctis luteolus]|nr:N-terminal Xaa-Pro-Lys N-methyltransferase 1 [Entophlyctis luteolus]KAJ3344586.1 N-terminal Xaa-Pro-Lys N-methyltransferase 1 [Entophlyctis luteolus]